MSANLSISSLKNIFVKTMVCFSIPVLTGSAQNTHETNKPIKLQPVLQKSLPKAYDDEFKLDFRDDELINFVKIEKTISENTLNLRNKAINASNSKEYDLAEFYYLKAIDQGDPASAVMLANIYLNELSKGKAFTKFLELMDVSINLGSNYAYRAVSKQYLEGVNIDKNLNEAIKWLKNGSNEGIAMCSAELGELYAENGNMKEAFDFFELALKQGNHGRTIPLYAKILLESKDKDKHLRAIKLLGMVADNSPLDIYRARALYMLGYALVDNKNHHVHTEGLKCLHAASDLEQIDAIILLANLYHKGEFVEQNLEKAEEQLKHALKLGCKSGEVLIGLYKINKALNKNTLAKEYIIEAAKLNSPVAWSMLGIEYMDGNIIQQSTNKGLYWLKKAANQKDDTNVSIFAEEVLKQYSKQQNKITNTQDT